MTLLRQIMLVVVAIFLFLFGANFVLTVLESRTYLSEQMRVHAQDTATSLGLSMTTAMAEQDDASLELLSSAVFDRGYYTSITLRNLDNEIIVTRSNPRQVDDVPRWFTNLVALPTPAGQTEISRGWSRFGTLEVVAHPGDALRDLWRISQDFLYLFLFIVTLSYGVLGLIVTYVMRPLKAVEAQADAICDREFAILEDIPRTRELKRVVEAMNRMSAKLKEIFTSQLALTESLRRETRSDPVTGLSNKQAFLASVQAALQSESESGSSLILLFQVRDFAQVNESIGFQAADDLLTRIAERLKEALTNQQEATIARLGGADFAVFIPRVNLETARLSLQRAHQQVSSLQLLTESEFKDASHMGAYYATDRLTYTQLMSGADAALRTAQAEGPNRTHFLLHADEISDVVKQATEWKQTLDEIIQTKTFSFHYQPVFDISGDQQKLIANEIFVRIELAGEIINAGVFMPMAERFGLLVALDKLIIERALSNIKPEMPPFVLNLSTHSLQNETFRAWLYTQLAGYRDISQQIIFELQEHAVHLAHDDVQLLVQAGNSLGYRFSVDHFGAGTTSFAYLQSLNIDFIKVDRSFVDQIDKHQDNQFFVRSVAQIAHTRDMTLIAEGIERPEELAVLRDLGVDAAMGYLLGRPEADFSLT